MDNPPKLDSLMLQVMETLEVVGTVKSRTVVEYVDSPWSTVLTYTPYADTENMTWESADEAHTTYLSTF